MATEVVELQVRVEDEDPRVNITGLMILGIAAGGDIQWLHNTSDAQCALWGEHSKCVRM